MERNRHVTNRRFFSLPVHAFLDIRLDVTLLGETSCATFIQTYPFMAVLTKVTFGRSECCLGGKRGVEEIARNHSLCMFPRWSSKIVKPSTKSFLWDELFAGKVIFGDGRIDTFRFLFSHTGRFYPVSKQLRDRRNKSLSKLKICAFTLWYRAATVDSSNDGSFFLSRLLLEHSNCLCCTHSSKAKLDSHKRVCCTVVRLVQTRCTENGKLSLNTQS